MADAGFTADRFAESLLERAPTCIWFFNRAHEFHFVSGECGALFHRSPAELLHRHVSGIDDTRHHWESRLRQVFGGNSLLEQASPVTSGHSMMHIPLLARDGSVLYAAGFAYAPNQRIPAPPELELAAYLTLVAAETERTRTVRFLHDIVAQSLTGAGLQMELLRLETEQAAIAARATELQQMLEDALQRVRQFNAEELGLGAT